MDQPLVDKDDATDQPLIDTSNTKDVFEEYFGGVDLDKDTDQFKSRTSCPKTVDEFISWMMISTFFLLVASNLYYWVMRLAILPATTGDLTYVNSFALARLANDCTQNTMYFLVVALWHSLCYKSTRIHDMWRFQFPRGTTAIMAGGFVPRPTAMSFGGVLFLNKIFILESIVSGRSLLEPSGWHYDSCRPVDLELVGFKKIWFARVWREGPIDLGGYSCFGVVSLDGLTHKQWEFSQTEVIDSYGMDDLGPQTYLNASNLIHPYRPGEPGDGLLHSRECRYQCASWRAVGCYDFFKSATIILTGSAFIVKLTESLTAYFGQHFVSDTTSDKELIKILAWASAGWTSCFRWFGKSLCAFQLILLVNGPLFIASHIDGDGFYTVDYYVTVVLLCSSFTAVVLRRQSPATGRIVYTEKLWKEGSDEFLRFSTEGAAKVTIDLYQWMHLTQKQRCNYLHVYSRTLDDHTVDEEIVRQQSRFEMYKKDPTIRFLEKEALRVRPLGPVRRESWEPSEGHGHLKLVVVEIDEQKSEGVVVRKEGKGKVVVMWEKAKVYTVPYDVTVTDLTTQESKRFKHDGDEQYKHKTWGKIHFDDGMWKFSGPHGECTCNGQKDRVPDGDWMSTGTEGAAVNVHTCTDVDKSEETVMDITLLVQAKGQWEGIRERLQERGVQVMGLSTAMRTRGAVQGR